MLLHRNLCSIVHRKTDMTNIVRLLLIAFLTISLVSCSSTTFVYNRLDYLIPWYLDDYVDLDRQQSRFLDERLVPFLSWHRYQEIPLYVSELDKLESLINQPLSANDIESTSLALTEAWERIKIQALDWLLPLGEKLSEQQISDYIGKMYKRQKELEEKYLTRDEQAFYDDVYENFLESLEDYMGRLNSEQKQLLRSASTRLERTDHLWLAERAAWLQQIETLLKQRGPDWQTQLKALIERPSSDENQSRYDNNFAIIYNALAEVINSRTDKQDARLRREIASLKGDLVQLAAQTNAQAK